MAPPRNIRNLGILAHVDAGKTTLTEHMLFLSGSIQSIGRVDKGTSLSDKLEVERRRGISVQASTLSFMWRDVQFNIIDTPGHMDFSAEVERTLRVLDCAVLVLSAVAGIQSQTKLIWDALSDLKIPVLLFINKIDRIGADSALLIERIRDEFSSDTVLLNQPEREGESDATVRDLFDEETPDLIETIVARDDQLLEHYLDGLAPSKSALSKVLRQGVKERQLFPILCGSAKNNVGTEAVMAAIAAYFPNAGNDTAAPVSGVVFKLGNDPKAGRIAGVRLFTGRLKNRDIILNDTAGREEKITQIKKSFKNSYEDTGILEAGDIGFLCGLPDVQIGDVLGEPGPVPGNYRLTEPILSAQVMPKDKADYALLGEALTHLSSEDPHLNFQWLSEERELHVKIMGRIQMEILTEILNTRFGIDAAFSEPTVIYKETPVRAALGEESYTMPKPCWAIVKFHLVPGPRGSGVSYHSEVGVNDIKQKYQSEMRANVHEALKQGIKGWEVTDLEIVLVEGNDHVLHSRPGNFKLAMNIAILKGLTEANTALLEPILAFRIVAPEEYLGKISSDIIEMRGLFDPVKMADGHFALSGRFPLATSMTYAIRLSAITGGKAKLSTYFDGYELCPEGAGVSRAYKGISPLDRSKYILKMRGAITAA